MYIYFIGETPGNFDIIIENDDLEEAYEILRNFIIANFKSHCKIGKVDIFHF
jgi:guanylate kinase